MKVICISGKAQHGKDTTAKMLKATLEADGYNVLIVHYADLLKHICKSFFGWDGEKNLEGRELLQYVGTDVIRGQRPDYWVDFITDVLTLFPDEWDYVLIPDCRFPNELRRIKDAGFELIHMRVLRYPFTSPLTPEQQNHISETALDNFIPDFYMENTGTLQDLMNRVCEWVSETTGSCQMVIDGYFD